MALKFIADNSAEDIVAALPDSYVSGDRATYARAVENARAIFTRDGHFTPADLETPLKVLREFNTDVAKADIDLSRPTPMPSSSVPTLRRRLPNRKRR